MTLFSFSFKGLILMLKRLKVIFKRFFNIRYRYFISYDFMTLDNKYGKGNSELTTDFKIKKINDISYFQNLLKKENRYEWVTINNFIRLK